MVASMRHNRHSIGIEIDRDYCKQAARRLKTEASDLFIKANLVFERAEIRVKEELLVEEDEALYKVKVGRKKKKIQQSDEANPIPLRGIG